MPLTGPEIEKICLAITTYFTRDELDRVLRFRLSERLDHITSEKDSFTTIVFDLVNYYDRLGGVDQLLQALRTSNTNPEFHSALGTTIPPSAPLPAETIAPQTGAAPGHQVTVSGAGAVAIGGNAENVRISTGHTDQSGGMHFHAGNIYIGQQVQDSVKAAPPGTAQSPTAQPAPGKKTPGDIEQEMKETHDARESARRAYRKLLPGVARSTRINALYKWHDATRAYLTARIAAIESNDPDVRYRMSGVHAADWLGEAASHYKAMRDQVKGLSLDFEDFKPGIAKFASLQAYLQSDPASAQFVPQLRNSFIEAGLADRWYTPVPAPLQGTSAPPQQATPHA